MGNACFSVLLVAAVPGCEAAQRQPEPVGQALATGASNAEPLPTENPNVTVGPDQAEAETDGGASEGEGEGEAQELALADGWREVGPGDSLNRIFAEGGLDGPSSHRLVTALEPHFDVTRIRPGQLYRLRLEGSGEGEESRGQPSFELRLDKTSTIVATGDLIARDPEDSDAPQENRHEWTVELRELPSRTEQVRFEGRVEKTLWDAVKGAGADPLLVNVLVDAFAHDIDFNSETRVGDEFRLLVDRVSNEETDEFIRYGRVMAAEYSGEATGEKRIWYWAAPGKNEDEGAYYDDEGKGVARSFLKSPLKFSRVSSGFNPKRMHPILHREKGHMGTDYAAPEGAPVWAAADGRISVRGDRGGAGNMVVINHQNGLVTMYMHLSRFEEGQRVGSTVKQKDVIGYVGMTGLATGPHLHFGVKKNGRYVDPQSVEKTRAPGVPQKHMAAFQEQRRGLEQQLKAASP